MQALPIRLLPGDDLRQALESVLASQGAEGAFVVAGIGSLVEAQLRFAGEEAGSAIAGPLEIVSLSGTLSLSGAHLHMSVADASGRVYGGHVAYGCVIRTTGEILIAMLEGWVLKREIDLVTGYGELVVRRR